MLLRILKHRSLARLIILATVVSLTVQLQLMLTYGFMAPNFAQHFRWYSLLNISLISLYTGGTILGAITTLIEPTSARLMSVLSSQALAVLAAVGLASGSAQISPVMLLTMHLIADTLFCFSILTVMLSYMKVPGHISLYARLGSSLAILGTAAIGLLGRSWLSIETVSHSLPTVRDVALFLTPIIVLFTMSSGSTIFRSPKLWWESIVTHLPSEDNDAVAWRCLLILSLIHI